MTDAPKEQVLDALSNLDVKEGRSGEYPFGTEYKLFWRHLFEIKTSRKNDYERNLP